MYTVYIYIYINMENVSPFKLIRLFWLSILNFRGQLFVLFVEIFAVSSSKLQKGYHVFDGICEDGSNEEQGPHQRIPQLPTTTAPRRISLDIIPTKVGPQNTSYYVGAYITPLIDTVYNLSITQPVTHLIFGHL